MRSAGKDDFLPQHIDRAPVVGADDQAGQPGEDTETAGNVDGFLKPFAAIGAEGLKEDVLAGLVDPGQRDGALLIDRHGRVVDEIEIRCVHPPRPPVSAAGGNLDPLLPGHLERPDLPNRGQRDQDDRERREPSTNLEEDRKRHRPEASGTASVNTALPLVRIHENASNRRRKRPIQRRPPIP